MKKTSSPIFGVTAPAPRLTARAALLLAVGLSLPVACVMWAIEWVM
ncbi:hypothetical protein [Thalassovita taeanensis]|nr:hypothetical protein [Thalassovita taeanensis]